MMRWICVTVLGLALGIAIPGATLAQGQPPPQAKGDLLAAGGETVGNVLLTQLSDGTVLISGAVRGLPPGEHGIVIHERGACSPSFDAAGGPLEAASDLPNIRVMETGMGSYTQRISQITVAPGDRSVLDADGSAVLIHAGGPEGSPVACAALAAVPVPQPIQNAPLAGAVTLKSVFGETLGTATMTQNADGAVRIQAQVRGLPPGEHGIHVHQFGACAPTFAAAGEHYNPTGREHGLQNPDGPHAGDLPNLMVNADGTGTYDYTSSLFTLSASPTTIFDTDGSALVIHATVDDQVTDPSGNSMGRIVCGAVEAASAAQPAEGQQAGGQQGGTPQPATLPQTAGEEQLGVAVILTALALLFFGMLVRRAWPRA